MEDPFIREKNRQLANVKKMYDTTSGEVKEMWRKKWYDLVKVIETRIREIDKIRHDLN